jgi:hypothetical protein
MNTPWPRAAIFYWAFVWRGLLLFALLMIPFYLLYGFVMLLLEQHPLIERLIRLTLISGAMLIALCWGLQWAMGARFGAWSLRAVSPAASDSTSADLDRRLTLPQALKVVWAQLWRTAIISLPTNLALEWLIFHRLLVAGTDWQSRIESQGMSILVGLPIGVWAMRQALRVHYGNFELKWLESPPSGTPDIAEPSAKLNDAAH